MFFCGLNDEWLQQQQQNRTSKYWKLKIVKLSIFSADLITENFEAFLNPITHGGGPLWPRLCSTRNLTPKASKLCVDTSWLFLNMPKNPYKRIKQLPKKINLHVFWWPDFFYSDLGHYCLSDSPWEIGLQLLSLSWAWTDQPQLVFNVILHGYQTWQLKC